MICDVDHLPSFDRLEQETFLLRLRICYIVASEDNLVSCSFDFESRIPFFSAVLMNKRFLVNLVFKVTLLQIEFDELIGIDKLRYPKSYIYPTHCGIVELCFEDTGLIRGILHYLKPDSGQPPCIATPEFVNIRSVCQRFHLLTYSP